MDIFFVISGLVIYLSTRDKPIAPGQFLLNRVLRIVPAYWFYTLLMALLLLVASRWMPHQVFDGQHLLLSLLFIPAENPGGYGLYPTLNVGWTLNFEMFFYLLFGLAFLVRRRHHLLLVSAALLIVSEVLGRMGVLSRFYSNGKLGNLWSVRQVLGNTATDATSDGTVTYQVLAGDGMHRSGQCSVAEFRQWARFEVQPQGNGRWFKRE